MHPRNIYKKPPNYADLASKYPEFARVSSIDLNGTVRLDFSDLNAQRILTRCLLLDDFNLNVEIPQDRLIPTVPLRLNYLLWLEDLLNANGKTDNVHGIDIGTGACCIYPLLAATKFKWKMLATEKDKFNLSMAQQNIKANNLQNQISVTSVSSDDHLLFDCFSEYGGPLKNSDFCMCNPPFYSSINEIGAGSPSRPPPKTAQSGSIQEITTPGGEESFVRKLIKDSVVLRKNICIYTTMLGHKKSLKPLIKILESYGVKNISHTMFCQGKTARWGLAWSFSDSINLNLGSVQKKKTDNKPLHFVIPPIEGVEYNVKSIALKIINILQTIDVETKTVQHKNDSSTWEISASKNTWSHQRRKRREMLSKRADDDGKTNGEGATTKRKNTDSPIDGSPIKKIKLANAITTNGHTHEEVIENGTTDKINNNKCSNTEQESNGESNDIFLKAALCICQEEDGLHLQIGYLNGPAGRDGVHQITQYIKNNWK